jgi:hypothetical protein
MAYASTVTVEHIAGGHPERVFRVTIAETDCGPTSETGFTLSSAGGMHPVRVAQMYRVQAAKASGSATTLQPRLGASVAASGVQIQYLATAAASVDDQPAAPVVMYGTSTGTFYHRSQPDTGSDNAVTTVYIIEEGL